MSDLNPAVVTTIAIATMALIHTYYARGMPLAVDDPPPEVER